MSSFNEGTDTIMVRTGRTKGRMNINSTMNPPCKLCWRTILPEEARVWLRKPMGLSHAACADDRPDVVRV